mmetsp:Transcript_8617/g.19650  ORF Transcript_8617/g.19650 Transcript_8617/m.19650 type:complete len:295 (-) Transcript_8617:121-1005(-)
MKGLFRPAFHCRHAAASGQTALLQGQVVNEHVFEEADQHMGARFRLPGHHAGRKLSISSLATQLPVPVPPQSDRWDSALSSSSSSDSEDEPEGEESEGEEPEGEKPDVPTMEATQTTQGGDQGSPGYEGYLQSNGPKNQSDMLTMVYGSPANHVADMPEFLEKIWNEVQSGELNGGFNPSSSYEWGPGCLRKALLNARNAEPSGDPCPKIAGSQKILRLLKHSNELTAEEFLPARAVQSEQLMVRPTPPMLESGTSAGTRFAGSIGAALLRTRKCSSGPGVATRSQPLFGSDGP